MKAQILDDYGDADQFRLGDLPRPEPSAGQVRIRVRAIGLNPMEVKLRSGALKDQMPTDFPAILGTDVAGEVDAVADDVDGFSVGDRVTGLAASGAYAAYAVAPASIVSPIPDGLDFPSAATVPTAAETAGRMIRIVGATRGETVVVNGAAGSVGSAAVQLLVRDEITVIGTASSNNHAYLRSLGAEPTTYGDGVADRIRDIAPDGVDAVLDVAGRGFVDAAIDLRGGTDRIVTISDFAAAAKGITVSYGEQSQITGDAFASVLALAASGDFVTEIAETFPFEAIADAHRLSEQGHLRGKIVITGPERD